MECTRRLTIKGSGVDPQHRVGMLGSLPSLLCIKKEKKKTKKGRINPCHGDSSYVIN